MKRKGRIGRLAGRRGPAFHTAANALSAALCMAVIMACYTAAYAMLEKDAPETSSAESPASAGTEASSAESPASAGTETSSAGSPAAAQTEASAGEDREVISRLGSRGKEVLAIQQALAALGYYEGAADGVFDLDTALALRGFQQANGLPDTGRADRRTVEALGLVYDDSSRIYEGALYLLARLIAAEAGDAPYVEQVTLAESVLARVDDPAYPDSLAGVIFEEGAYASVRSGQFYRVLPEDRDLSAAADAIALYRGRRAADSGSG